MCVCVCVYIYIYIYIYEKLHDLKTDDLTRHSTKEDR